MVRCYVILVALAFVHAKLETEEETDTGESGDERELDETGSSERIGAAVSQITKHPYAASLLKNNTYVCSAVILNSYWLITESKCFDADIISSYVTHRNLKNFTIRVGSSYNNKGGALYKITTLINNFDMKVSAVQLQSPLEFSSRVQAAKLPGYDEEVTLGYLASIIAWTPVGHMRVVNAPLIEASICDPFTKLLPGHYICVGSVQDLNRHFCRKDNGGAVVQNNTLIGMSSYLHSCAVYTRTHAFPKVSSFARWLDAVIWDKDRRPTTAATTTSTKTTKPTINTTKDPLDGQTPMFSDPRQYLLKLPFDPINVPLEPSGNSMKPGISLYESYLQKMARAKTSTTVNPKEEEEKKRNEERKREWMKKYSNAVMMMPPQLYSAKSYELTRLWKCPASHYTAIDGKNNITTIERTSIFDIYHHKTGEAGSPNKISPTRITKNITPKQKLTNSGGLHSSPTVDTPFESPIIIKEGLEPGSYVIVTPRSRNKMSEPNVVDQSFHQLKEMFDGHFQDLKGSIKELKDTLKTGREEMSIFHTEVPLMKQHILGLGEVFGGGIDGLRKEVQDLRAELQRREIESKRLAKHKIKKIMQPMYVLGSKDMTENSGENLNNVERIISPTQGDEFYERGRVGIVGVPRVGVRRKIKKNNRPVYVSGTGDITEPGGENLNQVASVISPAALGDEFESNDVVSVPRVRLRYRTKKINRPKYVPLSDTGDITELNGENLNQVARVILPTQDEELESRDIVSVPRVALRHKTRNINQPIYSYVPPSATREITGQGGEISNPVVRIISPTQDEELESRDIVSVPRVALRHKTRRINQPIYSYVPLSATGEITGQGGENSNQVVRINSPPLGDEMDLRGVASVSQVGLQTSQEEVSGVQTLPRPFILCLMRRDQLPGEARMRRPPPLY